MMKVKEIVCALEQFAPLPLQDGWDNAGMQVGLTEAEATGALLCLDVTEAVVDEAVALGYNLIVSHHPLIFQGLKSITGRNYVERCVLKALRYGICICSMHTNMDNAVNGVNYKIAEKLGMKVSGFLLPKNDTREESGSGIVGELTEAMPKMEFLKRVKERFDVSCLKYNDCDIEMVKTVALCGGSGAFLLAEAIDRGADVFLTGEIKYHEYFGHERDILMVETGHYESEQYTTEIFKSIINGVCPEIPVKQTSACTNPIKYL